MFFERSSDNVASLHSPADVLKHYFWVFVFIDFASKNVKEKKTPDFRGLLKAGGWILAGDCDSLLASDLEPLSFTLDLEPSRVVAIDFCGQDAASPAGAELEFFVTYGDKTAQHHLFVV